MTIDISDAAKTAAYNAALEAIASHVNGGSLRLYTGLMPALGDPPTGTLLVTIPLEDPAFGSGSGGSVTANGLPLQGTAQASGVPGYARVLTSGNAVAWQDDDIGEGQEQNITLDNEDVEENGTVTVTSWDVSVHGA